MPYSYGREMYNAHDSMTCIMRRFGSIHPLFELRVLYISLWYYIDHKQRTCLVYGHQKLHIRFSSEDDALFFAEDAGQSQVDSPPPMMIQSI